jgi:photosystem II stability/assembly factor-like uncharacterized protein
MNARVLLLALIIVSSPVCAQWTRTAPNLLGPFRQDCCGFSNVHYKDGNLWAGADELYRSPDSGRTWSLVFKPSARIAEINFFDRNIGIIGTLDGVEKTTNGGTTWKRILTSQNCFGAQFAGSPERIAVAADNGGFFYSDNGGVSWDHQSAGPHPHFVLANDDGSAFGFSGSGGNNGGEGILRFKPRDGQLWTGSQVVDYDCFYAVRHHCSGKIFLMNEEGHIFSDNAVSILVSDDEAFSWDTIFFGKQPPYFSAGMSVSPCCALYIQTIAEGILRSTDAGKTWTNIGGPSNTIDTRTVCAITDNIVVAVDAEGSIWRTTNSGGDSLYTAVTIFTPKQVIEPHRNADIKVPITVGDAHVGKGFSLLVHYDSVQLAYNGSFANNGESVDVPSQSWPGRALISFRASDITATSGVIGFSMFKIITDELYYSIVRFDSVRSEKMLCEPLPTETIIGNYPPFSAPDDGLESILTIQPNPSEGMFTLRSSVPLWKTSVVILDILGKEVYALITDILPDQPLMLNLSGAASGTYYLRIEQGEIHQTIPIIKK